MPRKSNDLKDRLARYRQIKISVIGRSPAVLDLGGCRFTSRRAAVWDVRSMPFETKEEIPMYHVLN